MAGKRGGFMSRLLKEDGSKRPLTDADRDRWLEPDIRDRGQTWGPPGEGFGPRPQPAGVSIMEMSPESPLGQAGIEEGDKITAVNGRSTPTETSLAEALNSLGPGERAELSVIREDSPMTVTVTAPR